MNTLTLRSTLLVLALAGSAHAQTPAPIFSNGSTNPAVPALNERATSSNGIAAPSGFVFSECGYDGSAANALAGLSTNSLAGLNPFRFASRLVVPAPGWIISSITFYAYQTDFTGPGSFISSMDMQIWSGRPGDPGASVVWGDTSTSVLGSSTPTNIYRIFSAAPGSTLPQSTPATNRLIYANVANVGSKYLAAGTYWLDWQYTTSDPNGNAFSPTITLNGSRAPATSAARQLKSTSLGDVWSDVSDPGKPSSAANVAQDLPFIVTGIARCKADVTGLGGTGGPDGLTTVDDLIVYLGAFFSGNLAIADVTNLGGAGAPDGQITVDDLIAYLASFFACG
jgi:hypothetical protein